ncbi:MAG TPA: diguanylate cyclase [Kofleriaceae bacterium]|nr:diguanylate cyclase [Kofleriaceae bacterium]
MSRAKSKRAGTRGGGGTNVGKKPTRAHLPDDLADAAEAALDDLLSSSHTSLDDDSDEPATRAREGGKGRGLSTHEVSLEEIIPIDVDMDDEGDDDPLTRARPRRLPSKVAPLASATPKAPAPTQTSSLDVNIDTTNPVEPSDVEELDDDEPATAFQPKASPPSRNSSTHTIAREPSVAKPLPSPPARISSPHAVATPARTAHTIPRTGQTPPHGGRVSAPLAPEDTSAHTIARDDASFGAGSSNGGSPTSAARTPTPQPSRAPLPPPSGSSMPSSSRLPLPPPTESRLHGGRVDPETIEKTTGRETKAGEADARKAWLQSARFDRSSGDHEPAPLDEVDLDSEPFERPDEDRASLDHIDLDSAPFERSDSASPGRVPDSAPFGRVPDSASFTRVPDSAPFERSGRSARFEVGPLDDALAGLEAEPRGASQSGEERALFEMPALRFAVYEDPGYLSSAQNAIVEAGHVVAAAGAGRDALKRVGDLIRTGSIDVVLVSLPGGETIIDAAMSLEPRRPTIIASLSASSVEAVSAATLSGADLATTRPHDVERIAPLALAAARIDAERRVAASAKGAEQVLRQRLEDLADAEPGGLLPFEHFQRVLEIEIKRAKRFIYPLSVALFAVEVTPPPPPAGILGILRARAGNALINTIRDIDIATQLDHERFLVLLPYTDLKGAAAVGKRVIAAVAKGHPVVSDGRTFPPRVIGACAGMKKGEPISFAKLMKDATRALESARRDGADLAVQP